jgi:3-deoxy-7-phosphoheptulonate synthase
LASGLSAPIGFKNSTDGDVKTAVDAIVAASHRHNFLSIHKNGQVAIVRTGGNADCHLILRGGLEPNYDEAHVASACAALAAAGLPQRLMVDCSHANSNKQYLRQLVVADAVGQQIARGDTRIIGLMVESHLEAGRQDLVQGQPPRHGQSITDACLGWDDSATLLDSLAERVRSRRNHRSGKN